MESGLSIVQPVSLPWQLGLGRDLEYETRPLRTEKNHHVSGQEKSGVRD
ncbi:hypothetical protein SAMN04515695_1536 [Pseudovibrio sp. Tun.PSC04-5.I4]|nr:hypothetical protein SAMN04515695_1536 [Pseudovibrio sp. Tun.PSC04-5.I4]